jgi:hypothetical protein
MVKANQMETMQNIGFDRRVRKIDKRHRKLALGYVNSVNHDGLVIARVRRTGINFPFRGLFMVLIVFLIFKGFLHAALGAATYADRVGSLNAGTMAEKFGAYVMAPDVATLWISEQFTRVLP